MKRTRVTAMAIGLALCAGVATAQQRVAVVTNPDWQSRPDAKELAEVYPPGEMEGRVRLRCKVAADGALESCEVAMEDPQGAGFGEAALKLAPKFKMKPLTRDGEPVAGALVQIPIVFKF